MTVVTLAACLTMGAVLGLDRSAGASVSSAPQVGEHATGAPQDTAQAHAEQAGIDVDAVVEGVSHRVTAHPALPGTLVATDPAYRATFDASGFALAGSGDQAAFEWSLDRVSRGTEAVDLDAGTWTSEANVAERRVATGATERVTARAGELEWDLVLASAPAGSGDLIVEADLSGIDGAPQRDGAGWRLALEGGASLRLGELVVVDAAGTEVHRALPDIDGRRLSMTVPDDVLDSADYPLTLDPTVTPEHLVSGVPTSEDEELSAVASDGTDFLVVWTRGPFAVSDIYGTRVTADGEVLDPAGIVISTAADRQDQPAVAFDGTNYLVVWDDNRSGTSMDIYGARVSTTGVVLDDINGFSIASTADDESAPTVAFDGTNYLVAWTDRSTSDDYIVGARVSPAGAVLDPNGISISKGGEDSYASLAFDGTNFLAVWQVSVLAGNDIYGARVSPDGVVLDAIDISISTSANDQIFPSVASNGTNFLVVWDDRRSNDQDIYGARISPAGVVLNPNGIPISTRSSHQVFPSVTFGVSNYLVVWDELFAPDEGISGARVTPGGSVLTDDILISSGDHPGYFPVVAFSGAVHLVVWMDSGLGGHDILGARVSAPGGEVLDAGGQLLSTDPVEQSEAALAFDGTNFLVAWEDKRDGARDIYAARVTPAGEVLDPRGIAVSTAAGGESTPDVVFNGTDFLVVWQDARLPPGPAGTNIYAARVSPEGEVLDPTGIEVSNGMFNQANPAVVFDGTNTLVVWDDLRSGTSFDIYGARITNAGVVLNPNGLPISTDPADQSHPSVAFDGTRHLVAWQDQRSATSDIYGARVTKLGIVLNPNGIAISTAADDQELPAVAFDGANNLVVWQDRRSGTGFDIYGTGVTTTGTVTHPAGVAVNTATGDQRAPAVAFNGTYLVAWRDRRVPGTDNRIFATRFNPDGTVEDNPAFAVANIGGDHGKPDLTAGPGDQWGIAYDHPITGGDGIYLRTVAPK